MISTTYLLCLVIFILLTHAVYSSETPGATVVNYDAETFVEGLKRNRNFVMFYAPWCGHCKNLAPTWEELGRIYNNAENSPVIISKVDCTVYKDLCALHNILGFPTLKLFTDGGTHNIRYKGRRDLESLKKFIQQKSSDKESGAAETEKANLASVDKPKIDPVILTSENFAETIGKGYFFIDFFAPWCGHCKQLAPVWEHLAETYNSDNKVTIAKIDCTENAGVCKQYDITGYPTLLWFKNGQKVDKYKGQRTYEALRKYVAAQISEETVDRVEAKPPASLKTSRVVKLTGQTFESHITSNNLVFIKFFAPWCGHCKKLIPVWEELAEAFHDQPVSIAEIDCTQNEDICKKYQ
ncbi:unnamed protein product, partial [Candidula unifasciata]